MTITYTADQIRQRYVDAMGEELGKLYHVLWEEIRWLHTSWGEYVSLFGTSPERIEVLNRAANGYFYIVEQMMWDQVILSVTHFTDKPAAGDQARLTLLELPRAISDKGLCGSVWRGIKKAEEKAEFCRDWRNRHVAHRNLDLALERPKAKLLKPGSRKKMQDAIDAVAGVLHTVGDHYGQPRINFEVPIRAGAEHLVYILDDWLELQRTRREDAAGLFSSAAWVGRRRAGGRS